MSQSGVEAPAVTRHRNVFPSLVEDVVYQGNFTRVIATLGGVEVIAVVPNVARVGAVGPRPGQAVYLSIEPGSFCLFGEDGQAE